MRWGRHDRVDYGEELETVQIPKAAAKAGAWIQGEIPLIEEPFIKPWMIDLAYDHYALDITRARTLLDWNRDAPCARHFP